MGLISAYKRAVPNRFISALGMVVIAILAASILHGSLSEFDSLKLNRELMTNGQTATGVVTEKHSQVIANPYGFRFDYYLSYKFTIPTTFRFSDGTTTVQNFQKSGHEEVYLDEYKKYSAGSAIAIKYDRNDFNKYVIADSASRLPVDMMNFIALILTVILVYGEFRIFFKSKRFLRLPPYVAIGLLIATAGLGVAIFEYLLTKVAW